jgi:hypothetical protein
MLSVALNLAENLLGWQSIQIDPSTKARVYLPAAQTHT